MEIDGTKRDLENMRETRAALLALRAKRGAETAVGHACSNLLEMTENLAKSEFRDQRKHLAANIERQMQHLSTLRRGQLAGDDTHDG